MGYSEAMEAAGAKVLVYESFGSYQGDWWAVVEFNGKRGFVAGSYGSCSGCDAFEDEFGYSDEANPEKLAAFGRGYLEAIMDAGEAIAHVTDAWRDDAGQRAWVVKTATELVPENPLPTKEMAQAELGRVFEESEIAAFLTASQYDNSVTEAKARIAAAFGPRGMVYFAILRA